MSRTWIAAVVLALPALAAAPPERHYGTLAALVADWRDREAAARRPEDLRANEAWYKAKLLTFAERNPKDDDAFPALVRCVLRCRSHVPKGGPGEKAVAILRRDHVGHPQMARFAPALGEIADDGCGELLRAVADRHPDRRTRAKACHALAKGRRALVELAETLNVFSPRYYLAGGENLRIYFEHEHQLHGTHGEEFVRLVRKNARRYAAEAEAMAARLAKEHPGMFPDVSVGKPAPEVVSRDLDGKEVRLSDYKGKVVVLDVWATWCGPCRAMIPHQRGMVKRLEGKPFALISVSVDDGPEKVKAFLKKTPMPWAHWWCGAREGMAFDWDVRSYPSVYVIDAEGVIRFEGLRDEKLEAAVVGLLKEREGR